ncbi:MAG: DNA polymerase [Planctomycetota bacterium]
MNVLTLDFETYFDTKFSLKRLTIPEYVHDPRFHVHGLAIRWPDGRTEFRVDVPEAIAELQRQFGPRLERVTVVFHNAYFDMYVLRHRYGLSVQHFVDTMLLSHHVNGRKGEGGESAALADLAQRYGLDAKGNLSFMGGVRNPTPQQLVELADYAINDANITYQLAALLLPQITRPEVELPIMQHTVRLFVERSIAVDTAGIDGLATAAESETTRWLTEALGRLGETGALPAEGAVGQAGIAQIRDAVSKDRTFTELLKHALERTGRLVPLKNGKKGPIPAVAKKDLAMQELLHDSDPVVAALAHARTGKKSEDQVLAKLETLKRVTKATGGVLPPYLRYGGASTLRFSGGQKFNIQNLGRDGLGLEMRKLLMARPGHKLIVGDLAQIEARITAWCAGQEDMLAQFAAGNDIYSEFASETLHEPVRKPLKTDPLEVQHHLKSRRQVGKTSILGLGYSMGASRFMNTLRADPLTALLFVSGVLSPLVCRDVVRAFRSKYARIPEFWNHLEGAFRLAISGVSSSVGALGFECRDKIILLYLPSGRALRYSNARLEDATRAIKYLDAFGEAAEFIPEGQSIVYGSGITIYGGKLCENVVQATARDILVEAILRLETQGWPVLFHVHDEIVLEVPEQNAESAQAALKQALEAAPSWAAGLPLAAEVTSSHIYGK